MAAISPNVPTAQIPPNPGSQPAQLQPGEQEKIQGAMLQNATNNRDYLQKELAKPSDQFIADETTKLQQQRQSDSDSADFAIKADTDFIPSNPGFWTGVQQRDIQRKADTLAKDDQLISTVPQREPELRAQKQSSVDFYNQRIAQLQAGPVPISNDEARLYRQVLQSQAQTQADLARARAAAGVAPAGAAGPAGGAAPVNVNTSLYQSSFAAAAPRPPVAGLFGN